MATRHTCLKLELPVEDPKREGAVGAAILVKGTWHPSRFSLAVTDGVEAWICDASEAEVKLRAEQWDLAPQDYVALAERYLGFQQPGSRYAFDDAAAAAPDGPRREEVVRKTQAFDKLKEEAERCLQQSERFSREKVEFESSVYSKFVAILNSKKAKLRELKDRISKLEATGKAVEDDDDDDDQSSGKTESFHEASDEENIKEEALQEKSDDAVSMKGRKKARR